MGWLDVLKGARPPAKKKYRGKSRPAQERIDSEIAAYLRKARTENKPLYEKMMQKLALKKLGIVEEGDPETMTEAESSIKTVLRLKDLLRDEVDEERFSPADFAPLIQAIPAILAMLNPAYAQALAAQAQAQQVKQLPAASTEAPSQPVQEEAKVSLASMFVINSLNGKTPDQAATWLLNVAQQYGATGFVQTLCQASDDQLPAYLSQASAQYPDLAGAIAWLRQRPDWLVDTIAAIRRQAQGATSSAI